MNTIKIKTTTTYRHEGRLYPDGAILDVDPKYFDGAVMVKYVEPVMEEEPVESEVLSSTEKPVVTVTAEEPPTEVVTEEPKKSRRKRKF